MTIKAFIFDWAGTMIDFGCMAPVQALQAVFAAEGVDLSDAEARADMGMAMPPKSSSAPVRPSRGDRRHRWHHRRP
jgi:beta-phosphoglucomutase-like phosphatase (HAD superfamily)